MSKEMVKAKGRKNIIADIKSRITKMSNTCSAIRTLNGAFQMFSGHDIVLCLQSLIASWDSDRRPRMRNGVLSYIDFKKNILIVVASVEQTTMGTKVEKPQFIPIKDLTDDELGSLYFYMNQMIPKL